MELLIDFLASSHNFFCIFQEFKISRNNTFENSMHYYYNPNIRECHNDTLGDVSIVH